jgi:hypothetical protein
MKKILFNPFEKYDGRPMLTIGLVATVIGSLLGFAFNARYDGVIHISYVENVTFAEPFTDNVFNITCMFIAFYLFGYFINKKTRPIDILATVMIARLPFYITTLDNINGFIYKQSTLMMEAGMDMASIDQTNLIIVTALALLSLPFVVWYIALLYNGFKTAVHLKTATHKVMFVLAIIVAEVLSRIFFYIIY